MHDQLHIFSQLRDMEGYQIPLQIPTHGGPDQANDLVWKIAEPQDVKASHSIIQY